jgi:hypothetical protein
MLDLITGAASAIFAGGATGLLGVAFQRFFDFLHQRQVAALERDKMAHAVAMKKADAEIMREEWAQRTKIAQEEGQTRRDVAETEAFGKSVFQEPERYAVGDRPKGKLGALGWFVLALVDAVRGIIRPGLTLYLAWIATQLYEQNRATVAILDLSSDATAILEIHKHIVFTLLYLFTTCVLWWFGTRNKQQQPKLA